jgi:hypothetical protein
VAVGTLVIAGATAGVVLATNEPSTGELAGGTSGVVIQGI